MDTIKSTIKSLIIEYDSSYTVSDLCIGLAIEKFKDIRNYPKSYTSEKIEEDLQANINKLAMGAIELDAKAGVENQTSHSSNGDSRVYSDHIMAYDGVVGFATTM